MGKLKHQMGSPFNAKQQDLPETEIEKALYRAGFRCISGSDWYRTFTGTNGGEVLVSCSTKHGTVFTGRMQETEERMCPHTLAVPKDILGKDDPDAFIAWLDAQTEDWM